MCNASPIRVSSEVVVRALVGGQGEHLGGGEGVKLGEELRYAAPGREWLVGVR